MEFCREMKLSYTALKGRKNVSPQKIILRDLRLDTFGLLKKVQSVGCQHIIMFPKKRYPCKILKRKCRQLFAKTNNF